MIPARGLSSTRPGALDGSVLRLIKLWLKAANRGTGAHCHKRSYLRAKPGNGSLMAATTRNDLTGIEAKFKITSGAGYNSYNPL